MRSLRGGRQARQEGAQAAQRGRSAHPRRRAEPGHLRGGRRRRDRGAALPTTPTLACYTVTPAVVITIARGRVDLWKRIYPFMADRFRRASQAARAKARRHRRRQGGGRRLLHPPRPVGVDDAARAQDRRLHRVRARARRRARIATASSACRSTGASSAASTSSTPATPAPISAASIRATSTRSRSTCSARRSSSTRTPAPAARCARRPARTTPSRCTSSTRRRCSSCASTRSGKLGFGEGTPRKAKLRRMASKCDHCAFYEDQACITACPTGALVEILPSDVVTQLPDAARAIGQGRLRSHRRHRRQHAQRDAGVRQRRPRHPRARPRARAAQASCSCRMWWTVGIGAFLLSCTEIALRMWLPKYSMSLSRSRRCVEGIDPELALARVDYRPGCELAVNFGYAGTALMITGMLYVWRRRFALHAQRRLAARLVRVARDDRRDRAAVHPAAHGGQARQLGLARLLVDDHHRRLGSARPLPDDADPGARVDGGGGDARHRSPAGRAARARTRACASADVWFEAYRRRVANFDKLAAAARSQRTPTFFGALWTFFWVRARRRHARPAHPPARARS